MFISGFKKGDEMPAWRNKMMIGDAYFDLMFFVVWDAKFPDT